MKNIILLFLCVTLVSLTTEAASGRKKVVKCQGVSNKVSTKIKLLPRPSGARLVVNEESFNGSNLWERSLNKVKNSKKEIKYTDQKGKTNLTIDLLERDARGKNPGKFKYVDAKGVETYRTLTCDLN